ncbi:MAG: hypothetical protein E7587_03635 [Ruminococcaceae bacterium]|nr:hypothetical protein [Oscillospiraceae bacterium]
MKKVPISIIIDDPAPCVSVYHAHHKTGFTKDGRPVLEYVPNSYLYEFCDIIERYGMKGKFSVVPMPGNRGDIVNGIDGASREDLDEWMDVLKKRVCPRFSIGPEMLSHNMAVDLETGKATDIREDEWAATQDRKTLTPYISRAFSILREAGLETCGVTSPWRFAIEVEEEYVAAIMQAAYDTCGKKNSWYFLRGLRDTPNARPWVALEENGCTVVSIPATAHDRFWQTIDTTQTDDDYISRVSDALITADGKSGEIIRILETGGWPILITHWQSLVSNGLGTGMRALEEVGRRIETHLKDKVEWKSFEEILDIVSQDKASFPKPNFD